MNSMNSRRQGKPQVTIFASAPPVIITDDSSSQPGSPSGQCINGIQRPRSLNLLTPSSVSSMTYKLVLSPGTPQPNRDDLTLIGPGVGAIFFDFDGTLTASPGDEAQRCRKQVELRERAFLLFPPLRALRDAGITLGVLSKSSEATVVGALESAALLELFDGPVLCKAVGLEGKAGYIEDLVLRGSLRHLGPEGSSRVMLVDDDVRELDRARAKGIQTYAAPKYGGLQKEDFDEMFTALGLQATQVVLPPHDLCSGSMPLTGSAPQSSAALAAPVVTPCQKLAHLGAMRPSDEGSGCVLCMRYVLTQPLKWLFSCRPCSGRTSF